jgi:hypothetical protein
MDQPILEKVLPICADTPKSFFGVAAMLMFFCMIVYAVLFQRDRCSRGLAFCTGLLRPTFMLWTRASEHFQIGEMPSLLKYKLPTLRWSPVKGDTEFTGSLNDEPQTTEPTINEPLEASASHEKCGLPQESKVNADTPCSIPGPGLRNRVILTATKLTSNVPAKPRQAHTSPWMRKKTVTSPTDRG